MVTGYLLAGGTSSRMGREKALLPIGACTLIELVMRRLQSLVKRVVVIANAHNVHSLRDTLPANEILTDIHPGYGPLMGIYTGLMHTETTLNVFVPCDMPWVERQLVERLFADCRQGIHVVASLHPLVGVQPFPLVCQASAARSVGALLDRGERALQVLLQQPSARLITITEPELWRSFTNVNTLTDYVKLAEPTVTR
jgi:molybdopterin-guanine dinucleotide biosynthesis protein A